MFFVKKTTFTNGKVWQDSLIQTTNATMLIYEFPSFSLQVCRSNPTCLEELSPIRCSIMEWCCNLHGLPGIPAGTRYILLIWFKRLCLVSTSPRKPFSPAHGEWI
ncbi:hypothetical protein TNCV_2058611 [Trichonephila clavipes]|nr:hypothetical protein TNCV_2058611 [Trichonephila clavipes]